MRVFFDIEPVLGYPAGIPVYAVELARALQALADPPELVGGYATARWRTFGQLKQRVTDLGIDVPVSWIPLPGRLAGKVKPLAWQIARPSLSQIDIIHVTSCLPPAWLPFTQKTSILTVYDLGFVRFPNEGFGPPDMRLKAADLARAVTAAGHVIAISDFTKREICALFGTPSEKITVVPLASQWSAGPPADVPAVRLEVLEKYGLSGKRYFVAVSTISPRKNCQMLVNAFRKFRESGGDAELVIVGEYGWGEEELFSQLKQGIPGVIWARGVKANELAALYRSALASFMVSKYEGFGIPVIESMLCDCPVVYATGSSLGEVAGTAGVAVEPEDIDATARAFAELSADEALRQRLIIGGRQRAQQFSWQRTAVETHAVYRKIFKERREQTP